MNSSAAKANDGQKPVRKRSMWERLVVWGGIVALVGVVFVEWKSRQGHDSTLSKLEERLSKGKIPLNEVKGLIDGFGMMKDDASTKPRSVIVQWQSLFKRYKLRLALLEPGLDQVIRVENFDTQDGPDNLVASRPKISHGFKTGLPAGYENVFTLETRQPPAEMQGSLLRELIRQSFLIAAQDEYGLPTLDPSIGETIPNVESPRGFPFHMEVEVTRDDHSPLPKQPNGMQDFKYWIRIYVSHPNADGSTFETKIEESLAWGFFERVELLTELAGRLSLGPFVDSLKQAGYEKSVVRTAATSADEIKDHLDVPSQFARLRALQSQVRSGVSSPEVLGDLVRVYANLGSLTDYYWSSVPKVFKARSLIYARRLIAKTGETPYALSHLAYAEALAGRHMAALTIVESVRKAKGDAALDWLDLIEAYCAYHTDVLDKDEDNPELAAYLLLRMADSFADQQATLRAIERFLKLNPAGNRVLPIYGEMSALGVQRIATEMGYDAIWPMIFQRLSSIPDLPAPAKEIAVTQSRTPSDNPTDAYAARAQLIDSLQHASTDSKESGPAAWSMLAQLLRDDSAVQAWRMVEVQASWLGINADGLIAQTKPLVKGHVMEDFVDSYQSDGQKSLGSLIKFMTRLPLVSREMTAVPAGLRAIRLMGPSAQESLNFVGTLYKNVDNTYEDIVHENHWRASDNTAMRQFNLSEHWPQPIAAAIRFHWKEVEKDAARWERDYDKHPIVLNELAKRYDELNRRDDALRCLKKSLDAAPSYAAYYALAKFYRDQGDTEKWLDALEQALELPSLGLEDSSVHAQLAYYYMRKDEWQKAEPHAMSAANSYSGWGLTTAAHCLEGLGKFDEAERFIRAASQRYEESSAEWFLWCVRTDHGNLKAARAFADRFWKSSSPPFTRGHHFTLATGQIVKGDQKGAIATFREMYKKDKNPMDAVFAAVLADKNGDNELRDSLLHEVESSTDPEDSFVELSNLLRMITDDKGPWRPNEMESIMINSTYELTPYLYYLAGVFLDNHGDEKTGTQYLQCAATAFGFQNYGRTLAADELRQQGVPIDEPRLNVVPESIAPLIPLYEKASAASQRNELDKAISLYSEILKTRSDFLPAMISRAKVYEAQLNFSAAVADYERALQIDPDYFLANNNLGWLLAGCPQDDIRNGTKALEHAEHAASFRQFPTRSSQSLLAAAYAECGQFEQAIDHERQASFLPGTDPLGGVKMSAYKAGKPYRRKIEPADSK